MTRTPLTKCQSSVPASSVGMAVKLDVNAVLADVGNFGLYQWTRLLFAGYVCAAFSMQMFVTMYIGSSPDFRYV